MPGFADNIVVTGLVVSAEPVLTLSAADTIVKLPAANEINIPKAAMPAKRLRSLLVLNTYPLFVARDKSDSVSITSLCLPLYVDDMRHYSPC